MRQPATPNCAKPDLFEIVPDTTLSTEPEAMQPQMNVAESWQRLDAWLQSMPEAAPVIKATLSCNEKKGCGMAGSPSIWDGAIVPHDPVSCKGSTAPASLFP